MKELEAPSFFDAKMSKALRSLADATNSKMTDQKLAYFTEILISKGYKADSVVKACDELAMGDRFPNLGEFLATCRRHSKQAILEGCEYCDKSGFIHMEKTKEMIPGRPMKYETAFACTCEKGKAQTKHLSFVEGAKLGYTLCD